MTPLFLKIEIKSLSLHIAEFYSGLTRILNLRYLLNYVIISHQISNIIIGEKREPTKASIARSANPPLAFSKLNHT
jgi:hypothetical protein